MSCQKNTDTTSLKKFSSFNPYSSVGGSINEFGYKYLDGIFKKTCFLNDDGCTYYNNVPLQEVNDCVFQSVFYTEMLLGGHRSVLDLSHIGYEWLGYEIDEGVKLKDIELYIEACFTISYANLDLLACIFFEFPQITILCADNENYKFTHAVTVVGYGSRNNIELESYIYADTWYSELRYQEAYEIEEIADSFYAVELND